VVVTDNNDRPRAVSVAGETHDRKHRSATLNESVDLSGMEAGTYVLRVSARLASGEPVVREVPFAVR
jgi:hypothetical protein